MDTPAHIRVYQGLLRDADLLNSMSLSMNSNDWQSEMGRIFHDALANTQHRLDHLRAITLLRSIPQLVQTTPQVQAPPQSLSSLPPNTREELSVLPPGHLSPAVSPQQGDANNRQTEMGFSFNDALAEIQQLLDYIRLNTLLRGILQLVQATPEVRAPLRPLSIPLSRENSTALPTGHQSPPVSPDEMVIQQRGRRRLPVTWSPDIDLKSISFNSTDRTPPKIAPGQRSPQKVDVNLRSAPRKRLRFVPLSPEKIDFSDLSTPEKFKITKPVIGTPPTKRPKMGKL